MEGGEPSRPLEAAWVLRGVTSNERYVNRNERRALSARQEPLGRPAAKCAALIPITKPVFTMYREMLQREYPHLVE